MKTAILTVCGFLVSCSDKMDNPVGPDPQPTPAEQQAFDFDADIDKSVAPGVNFWQYAVGNWLNQHTANPGKEGTTAAAANFSREWVKTTVNATCSDPVLAALCQRASRGQFDFDHNVAELHKLTDRIMALKTREEVLREMGHLMAKGYSTAIEWKLMGNRKEMYLMFSPKQFFGYKNLEKTLRELKYSEAVIADLMSLAQEFYVDAKQEDEGSQSVRDYRYWQQPDNLRRIIPFSQYAGRATKTRAGIATAGELIAEGMGLDTKHIKLSDESVIDLLEALENDLLDKATMEDVKKKMLLSVVGRDYPLIQLKKEADVADFVYGSGLPAINYQLSSLYCQQNVTAEAKAYVAAMCEEFRSRFAQRLDRLEWLSDATRQRAHKKLQAVVFIAGEPNEWNRDFFVTGMPDGLTCYESALWVLSEGAKAMLQKLPGDYSYAKLCYVQISALPAWIDNALYAPAYNCVYMPALNMISPVTNPSYGDAYNYAVLGASTIGHELTHGFDNDGSKTNEDGIYEQWWAPADLTEFKKRQQLMIDHFSQFMMGDRRTDGELTLGENIADQGGLNMALDIIRDKARQRGLDAAATREQLHRLFLGWAQAWKNNADMATYQANMDEYDEHAQNPVRVNGQVTLQNDWYELFDVREGQPLYVAPAKRFAIW